jgi:hypothetical protein
MGARRLPFGSDPVDLRVARDAAGMSLRLTLQHARKDISWMVTLPAMCGDSLLRVTANGRELAPITGEHRGHLEVTAQGVFRAARTAVVRFSCRHGGGSASRAGAGVGPL